MLAKIRDLSSMPDGLMNASVELKRGMIVQRKLNAQTKQFEIALPENGKPVYGFVTLREDEATYCRSYYDTIEKGKKAVVYTLVKDNEWATDQVTDFAGLAIGDKVKAGTDGKLVKDSAGDNAIAEVIGLAKAGAGYETDTVLVKIL